MPASGDGPRDPDVPENEEEETEEEEEGDKLGD